MKLYSAAVIGLLFCGGCEKQYLPDDGYISEDNEIDAKEHKCVHFFRTGRDFNFSAATVAKMNKILRNTRSKGIGNIGFMLVSNQIIPLKLQEKAKKQIYFLTSKNGFMDSRVVDSGICVYKDAKVGVRLDVLKYEAKGPNCDVWSEYIGDADSNKHLPKLGASGAYNLVEMIVNKADLIAPRKYKGADAKSSIDALSSTGSTGSTSSGSSSSSGSRFSSGSSSSSISSSI
jgi:type IV pilus biogenesis protein CpaD/CtpE